MKCPKCGYLGFETVDRCRNCGYDFSLSADGDGGELPLRDIKDEASGTLADYDLGAQEPPRLSGRSAIDLDRLIGVPDEEPADEPVEARIAPAPEPLRVVRPSDDEPTPLLDAAERAAEQRVAEDRAGDERAAHDQARIARENAARERAESLPLFGAPRDADLDMAPIVHEEPPFVAPPRPAGPPLAVRRATPEVARPRNRAPRTTRQHEPPLAFPTEVPLSRERAAEGDEVIAAGELLPFQIAPTLHRVVAALIDVALLGGICAAVLYLTLRLADLTFDDVWTLPVVPMGAFLLLLATGYSIAFTAAGGQTIGKMATRIKVIAEDGRPVEMSAAVLRTAGNAVNLATLGLAWLPALFAADARSLADRLAGTRVVRA